MNLRSKATKAIKTTGKTLISGKYNVTGKLNRVGSAAHNISNNFVNDFQSDGPTFSINAETESPFRMGNTAETLPALQRSRQPQRQRHRHRRTTHKPRKIVYF